MQPLTADHYLLGWDKMEHLIPPAKPALMLHLHPTATLVPAPKQRNSREDNK